MKIRTEKFDFLKSRQITYLSRSCQASGLNSLLNLKRYQLSRFLIIGQTCMVLTLKLETLFFEALNTSYIYQITSTVRFVKGLANSILTYVPNMIHICPNTIYSHLWFITFSHQRKEKREKRSMELSKRQGWQRSAFTMQHLLVRLPTAARPPPHHQIGSNRLVPSFTFSFSFLFFLFSCSDSTLL